jgi:hypothetical protein
MTILNRTSNNINIATFWENYDLKKYNFSPDYQREGDVWSETDKSYLIDTILKNFPMPPIFLHQHIDTNTGKTIYDVIDGKQRLSAIISFLQNDISVPEDFSDDGFGDSQLSGVFFRDLDTPTLSEWKKSLWKYEISIEYIETDDIDVVNHIFDRLNRNGEPLTHQELRKARFGTSDFYNLISEFSGHGVFSDITDKLKSNRLENHEFISELILLVSENTVISGDHPLKIDDLYQRYSEKSLEELNIVRTDFSNVESTFSTFNINFTDKRFYGVSHIFGLWGLAWKLNSENIVIENIQELISDFYSIYKLKDASNPIIENYRITMSAGTKGAARRKQRIEALYEYVTQT